MARISSEQKELQKFFEIINIPLMYWQLAIITVIKKEMIVGISVRRQTGKTQLVLAMMFAKALIGQSSVFFGISSTQVKDVMRRGVKAARILEKMGLVDKIADSHGMQVIYFKNGARCFFRIQTSDQFEGLTDIDFLIYDEAQKLPDEFVEATLPLFDNSDHKSAVFLGTPPTDDDFRQVGFNTFHRLHDAAGPGWIEYSAYPKYRSDLVCDLAAAKRADPAWRRKKDFAKSIKAYQETMSHEAFCRQILGVWKDRSAITLIPPYLSPDQVRQVIALKGSRESTFTCSIGLDVSCEKIYVAMSDSQNRIEIVGAYDVKSGMDNLAQWVKDQGRIITKVNIPATQRGKVLAKLIRSTCKTPVDMIDVPEMGARIDRFLTYLSDGKVKVYDTGEGERTALASFYLGFDTRSGSHFIDAGNPHDKARMLAIVAGTELFKAPSAMDSDMMKAMVSA